MRDIAVYVQVGKTGSSSMRAILLNAAKLAGPRFAATEPHESRWLCVPAFLDSLSDTTVACANAEVALRAEQVWGSGNVYRPSETTRRGHRLLTTLREPIARLVSEYAYMCQRCYDQRKFCGGMTVTGCPNVSFTQWVTRAPNHYARLFAFYWPDTSFFDAYLHGFPKAHALSVRDVARAHVTLTRASSFVIYTDEMGADALTQAEALGRLRAWLGGANSRAAVALAGVRVFPHANVLPRDLAYKPTPTERRFACEIYWADCALYRLIRNASCTC
jgi:hypothetical protein|tara:strand:+ start:1390 stop:2214 length:825 start_codon:yes stop_codon:yes gene_type:complete